ncbi:3'-5' exonuclease [Spirosoma foliorum]|uniref:3'-5' exonuclease n=1 Tax=Spirosoma foliorum TaxID=2710596 RepID=A0A7G5H5E7_9BACT|nr:3'-5' exonuclease [Spirosoma foliorum]QMW06339.1 3'-5' exonuclease [Spirosoma foliorum]
MNYYLDTETTGLEVTDEVIEIALVDDDGNTVINTLCRPLQNTEWPGAQRIHGIAPADVLRDDLPTLADLAPQLSSILAGHTLIIYNVAFDRYYLSEAGVDLSKTEVHCCQDKYAVHYDDYSEYWGNYKFKKLTVAADEAEFRFEGSNPHRALWDALACRAVWQYLTVPGRMEEVKLLRDKRWQDEADQRQVRWFIEELEQKETARLNVVNKAWEERNYPFLGIRREQYYGHQAKESAAVFCRVATGYPLEEWNTWYKWCRLPKVRSGQFPETWKTRTDRTWYMLRSWQPIYLEPAQQTDYPKPVAMYVNSRGSLEPLYDPNQLTEGVDWVPIADGWPEGFVSITKLQREYKVRKKDLPNYRPAFLKRSKYDDYLLYPVPAGAPAPSAPVRLKVEQAIKEEANQEEDGLPF